MEKRVLKAADRIIVTVRRVKESILMHYLTLDYHDVIIIPQGYDPADLKLGTGSRQPARRKMRITHAGTFYADRTPSVMLQALHNVFRDVPQMRGRMELSLIGNVRDEDQALVSKLGLQNEVRFHGYLDHQECARNLLQSDLLWLVLDNDFQSPGKLYEYIGTRKPILGSVVEGYIKQLVMETGAGQCVGLKDLNAHENALRDLFAKYERNQLPQISEDFAAKYNREVLTGELARQFESLMDIDKNAFLKLEDEAL
jgi:glycosyltransferase involved in cell wall biosynthesis